MKQIQVLRRHEQWIAESGNQILLAAATKQEVVELAVDLAQTLGEPVAVRIHRVDGTLQEERTFPRSSG
jgi:hypothetical protein